MGMPAWATDPSSMLITEAGYEALPSEVCKSVEVVDGRVVLCESPTPAHQRASGLEGCREGGPGVRGEGQH
jgi:hypothetical protein